MRRKENTNWRFLVGACLALTGCSPETVREQSDRVLLSDDGTGDWTQNWFLDGAVGAVSNGPEGLTLQAGPEAGNDADHVVLWTKQVFSGDLSIDFDYTRLDHATRFVNILYLFASGEGAAPYVTDIRAWQDLRSVPSMSRYFNHMHAYHISFAAFGNGAADGPADYVRARRYRPDLGGGLAGTDLPPDNFATGLFVPGVRHHITVTRRGQELTFRVSTDQATREFRWSTADAPPVLAGRIGFRHMFTRSAIYANIVIRQLLPEEPGHGARTDD